jgi:nitrate reductase beta subunit
MVWYIPPLSPVVDVVASSGNDGEDPRTLFAAISRLRIPLEYLAGLFTAGDTRPVERVLRRLAAMRSYMRDVNLGSTPDEETASAVGMTGPQVEEMYRLLAIAKYQDRYVIPSAHAEQARDLEEIACSLDYEGGPGMGGAGPLGESSGPPVPVANGPSTPGRVNLLNWDGNGRPAGLFPPSGSTGSTVARDGDAS